MKDKTTVSTRIGGAHRTLPPLRVFSFANERGFTLIEIIIVIAVIGIIFSVAAPAYQDMQTDARRSACKGALGGLRSGIEGWELAAALQTGSAAWPPIDSLRTSGVVMLHAIPPNPFQARENAPDSIVTGTTRGVTVGTRGGWAYNPSTGEIWANTNTVIGESGCAGETTIGENTW